MVRFKIEVGHNHGVTPGDIVGAIANEAGIDSQYIGHIQLGDDVSTVDLPDGMPKEIFQHLKKVRVRQQPLNLQPIKGAGSKPARRRSAPSTVSPTKPKAKKTRTITTKSKGKRRTSTK
jgi:ATP-dependent RNA helicase DeaD